MHKGENVVRRLAKCFQWICIKIYFVGTIRKKNPGISYFKSKKFYYILRNVDSKRKYNYLLLSAKTMTCYFAKYNVCKLRCWHQLDLKSVDYNKGYECVVTGDTVRYEMYKMLVEFDCVLYFIYCCYEYMHITAANCCQ